MWVVKNFSLTKGTKHSSMLLILNSLVKTVQNKKACTFHKYTISEAIYWQYHNAFEELVNGF